MNAISNEAKTEDLSPFYNLTFGPTTSVTCKPQRAEKMARDMAQLLMKGFTVKAKLWLLRPCPSLHQLFLNCYIRKLKYLFDTTHFSLLIQFSFNMLNT